MSTVVDLTALEILQAIKQKPRITPVMIAEELEMKQQSVRNILLTLTELGLVGTVARGLYEITELGSQILERQKATKK
jgi:Mn-dependent DtxR family transcriptional regulator